MSSISLVEQPQVLEQQDTVCRSHVGWLSTAAILALGSTHFQLFIYPSVPLASLGDPVLFLENAKRIVAGQLPYRDYLQFTTPGTELFYALLLRICSTRSWIPQVTMVIIAVVIAVIITKIAGRVLSGLSALIPALLFTGFVVPNSTSATHHWFSAVFILAAAAVLLDRTTFYRAGLAGALCGLAGFFTQTKMVAALLALIVFLTFENGGQYDWRQIRRRVSSLCIGAGGAFLLGNLYFIRTAGISRFVFCTITFPFRYYAAEPYNTWHVYGTAFSSHAGFPRLIGIVFVHAAIPLTYVIWFLYRRQNPAANQRAYRVELLMALIGIGMFAAIATSPSLLRLCSVSPPALVLLACTFQHKPTGHALRVVTEVALVLSLAIPLIAQLQWHAVLDTPTGRVAFFDADRLEEFRWALVRTKPGQPFFGYPSLSFALDLQNPTPVNLSTTSDFTRPSEADAIVSGLEHSQTPILMLFPMEYVAQRSKDGSDHMGPFRKYLRNHYRLREHFSSGVDVWVRLKSAEVTD